jgi:hypothetical protein
MAKSPDEVRIDPARQFGLEARAKRSAKRSPNAAQ